MIRLRVNGQPVELEREMSVSEYLDSRGVNPRMVAVEVNGDILERARFSEVELKDGDAVEIVRMVGGGQSAESGAP